ncbi:hypothetical protein VNO77_03521 [Canavalia gladiata]|uniref:Uncharacterized protein n=1 Tax=Canavalia gladiata TaxID=3824 RepID=A0AAN9MVN9_CANGL
MITSSQSPTTKHQVASFVNGRHTTPRNGWVYTTYGPVPHHIFAKETRSLLMHAHHAMIMAGKLLILDALVYDLRAMRGTLQWLRNGDEAVQNPHVWSPPTPSPRPDNKCLVKWLELRRLMHAGESLQDKEGVPV